MNASNVVISFIGTDGLPVTSEVSQDGTYTASGVLVGQVQISLAWNRPEGMDPSSLRSTAAQADDPKVLAAARKMLEGNVRPPFPDRYRDPAKSNLKTVIESGQNTYNVDLKKQ